MYFVTSNKNKLKEFEKILGIRPEQIEIDLEEIQEIEVEKVVEHKVLEAYEKVGKPVIVEDTGLYIEAWKGFPGALAKWVGKTIGFENIPTMLQGDRSAYAKTIIGYYDGNHLELFEGKIAGRIPEGARGEYGFGWDSIFIPEGRERTFAEIAVDEKNAISMRRLALEKLKSFL
ncbi:MAG: RdgB/HAM1 family non-canonical purine NTP pyrophosphatase, partial [bacterium]|nr:RdgB/HAM1 family non-canonical purine NTP pyrophosphatase [bacterium]